MVLENRGNNYGALAESINGPVHIYNTIENKRKLHSLMPKFIEVLAGKVVKEEPGNSNGIPQSYKIDEKISHNKLMKYEFLVNEYGNYYTICEDSFRSLDNVVTFSKERILRSISEKYKSEKRLLLSCMVEQEMQEIDIIRSHSDYIIDRISATIREEIMLNCNEEKIFIEDIDFCLPVFLCYAFVECKILERP